VPEFCSFDMRQSAVASRVGLKTPVP
jgi:hypothetical protein